MTAESSEIAPFTISVDESVLDDLRARLRRTRWPQEVPGAPWSQGADLGYMQRLVAHWTEEFDWRAQEQRINSYEQFVTDIDGNRIHFIHRRRSSKGIPIILTHGWPSSFLEMLPLVDRLEDFNVVVPSLPGYGFSSRPTQVGINYAYVANVWHQLMERLGYERYGASGGDFGAGVATHMAETQPDRMIGIHLSTPEMEPYVGSDTSPLSSAERAYVEHLDGWAERERGYSAIQSTKPQTVGYGLNDSPAGLAAWLTEKWRSWADTGGDIDGTIGRDFLLTTITLYWVTESITTSMRDYYDNRWHGVDLGATHIDTPTAMAVFANEFVPEGVPPREWYERLYNLQRWTEYQQGGHFAAIEQPDLLAGDIAAFFAELF